MVVTLLRQRGEAEDAHPEEPLEEGEEGAHEAEVDPEPHDDGDVPDPYDDADVPEPYRRPVGAGGALTALELAPDDEAPGPRSADLPIGMDLDGDEDWDRAPEEPSRLRMESGEDPGVRSGFRRQIEVGELDDLELDGDSETGAHPDVPADPGEEDDPPPGAGPGRRR